MAEVRVSFVSLAIVVLSTGVGVREVSPGTSTGWRILTGVTVIWVWDRSVPTGHSGRLVTVTLGWVEMITVRAFLGGQPSVETFIKPATVLTIWEELQTLSRTLDPTVGGGSHCWLGRSVSRLWI